MDFAGWFPSGPLTSLYALVLLAVTIPIIRWGDRINANIAGLLFLSWVLARTATWADSVTLQGMGTVAIILGLWAIGTRTALFVMALAAVKLAIYGVQPLGVLNIEQMWALSEVFAYLQLIVLFGGTVNGITGGYYLVSGLRRLGGLFSVGGVSSTSEPVTVAGRNMETSEGGRDKPI